MGHLLGSLDLFLELFVATARLPVDLATMLKRFDVDVLAMNEMKKTCSRNEKPTSPSSFSLSSSSWSLPRKKCMEALWTLVVGWKQARETMETDFESVLGGVIRLHTAWVVGVGGERTKRPFSTILLPR